MDIKRSDLHIREWVGLSIIKFICVAVLLFVHIHLMLVTDNFVFVDAASYFYKATDRLMVLSLFIYMLPMLAGALFRVELGNAVTDGTMERIDGERLLRSVVLLVGVGFMMNLVTGGVFYLFSWNVLQLLAVSFVAIVLVMRISSVYGVALVGIAALLIAEPLRNFFGNGAHGYAVNALIGNDKAAMFWPLVPWFGVVAFGFLFAHRYMVKSGKRGAFEGEAIALGGALLGVAMMRGELVPQLDQQYAWGGLFSPPLGVVLAALGLFSTLVSVANRLFNGKQIKKYGIMNSYSKGILWIYAIQMPVSLWLSATVKRMYPMDVPSIAYMASILFMWLLGWVIGAASIKLLQEKQIVITVKKIV